MDTNNKRRTIGLLIDDLAGWGFGDFIQTNVVAGVASMAKVHDVNLLCFTAGNLDSPNEWVKGRNLLFEFIDDKKVDGLIVLTTSIGLKVTNERVLEKLEQYKGIPIVTIGDTFGQHHSISINNYQGMRDALEHVIHHHNRRNIAFIKGSKGSMESDIRFQAYVDALEEHQIPYDDKLVYQGTFLFESGARAIRTLNEQQITYDAVVASNDNMAIGAMSEILKMDGKLPEHLSVIGFDDIEPSELLSLTTVKQSFYHEAQSAVEMLLSILKGESIQKNREIKAPLVVRSSCGCVPTIVTETSFDYDSVDPSTAFTTEQIKGAFLTHMDHMVELRQDWIKPDVYKAVRSDLENLAHSLAQELFFEQADMFFFAWRSIIFQAIQRKIDLSFMHNALSYLRVLTLDTVKGNVSGSAQAENLFQKARIQISDAVQRTSASLTYMSSLLSDQLEQLGEQLVSHHDLTSLTDVIISEFPKHGIREGYICQYENPSDPLDLARLMLGYRDGERIIIDENDTIFPTLDILPQAVRTKMEGYRYQFIVQTLHHTNHNSGYVLFSFDEEVNKAYELLRYRMSTALRVNKLIHDVTRHSLELESQVIARTRELSLLNEELQRQSIRDEMTGLLNRRGFMQRGKEAFDRAIRDQSRIILLFADLDNLKGINDLHGHAEGDLAIKMTAEVLQQSFNSVDIISRLAGDEFTVIVTAAGQATAEDLRRKIQSNIGHKNQLHNKPFLLSVSIGFTEYDPSNPCTFEQLMRFADEALYREKKQKKALRK